MTALRQDADPDRPVTDAGVPITTRRAERTLRGMVFGPEDGTPVLFIAGAATGASMRFGEELLEREGIRLLTMSRPGMAGSDEDPARTLDSTVQDYRALVEEVLGPDAEPLPVVANSQGGVFGLGAALSGWASSLVLVSPADEVAFPPIRSLLPSEATALSVLAEEDPEAAATILGAYTAEAMEAMVLGGAHPSDHAVYAEPDFLALYRRSLAEGFADGGSGYVRDTLIAMRPWSLALEDLDVPVTILFGERDAGHSPDLGLTLAARIPTARRTVVPEAGGALLWTHPQLVLEALAPQTCGSR
ncbi:alpha/beta fold hydrolase [Brachybacterium hainanense]|uniref:Alpha/beta fold hydrolase n=1 Tax=Brachybacterium hainanense TaxID=1541174 RepID=A0ABV6RAK3_9MICO